MNTSRTPSQEAIEELAHRYWEERGCPTGQDLEDWLRAERDLTDILEGEDSPSPDLPE